MPKLFSFTGTDPLRWREDWDAIIQSRGLYNGDMMVREWANLELNFDQTLGFPITVTRSTCRSPFAYRRSWNHIRLSKAGFLVIWFVRKGALKLVRSQGTCRVEAGQAVMIDYRYPFLLTCSCDSSHHHESFQATIPPHLVLTHCPRVEDMTETFSFYSGAGRLAGKLLDILVHEGECLQPSTAEPLVESFLKAVGEIINDDGRLLERTTSTDSRIADIERYIMTGFTDPNLSCESVASKCGISDRYLSSLLRARNTSFSEILWRRRLCQARDWLGTASTRGYSIQEISFRSGFKSAAHFSRMFKAVHGVTPRAYRGACEAAGRQALREDHITDAA